MRILLLFLLLVAQVAIANPITLVTLGDSLTEGDGDDGVGGGYPSRLITLLQTPYPGSTLNNLGLSGDTSTDLINRQLSDAVTALNAAPAGNTKVAIVWIGSNDLFGLYNSTVCEEYYSSISSCEDAERGYFSDNIRQILSSLQATGATLYIALLDDQSRRPVMTDPELRAAQFENFTDDDVTRMANQIPLYNDIIQNHATTYGATTVNFFSTTIFETEATLSDDGNHPNGAGYDAIADIWYQALTGQSATVYDFQPQILANGEEANLTVAAGNPINISVSLNAGSNSGVIADWWAGYYFNGNWYTYVLPTGWGLGINAAYQGGLFSFPAFSILNEVLAPGDYTFYFAIDTTPDGALSAGTLVFDSVVVRVE